MWIFIHAYTDIMLCKLKIWLELVMNYATMALLWVMCFEYKEYFYLKSLLYTYKIQVIYEKICVLARNSLSVLLLLFMPVLSLKAPPISNLF